MPSTREVCEAACAAAAPADPAVPVPPPRPGRAAGQSLGAIPELKRGQDLARRARQHVQSHSARRSQGSRSCRFTTGNVSDRRSKGRSALRAGAARFPALGSDSGDRQEGPGVGGGRAERGDAPPGRPGLAGGYLAAGPAHPGHRLHPARQDNIAAPSAEVTPDEIDAISRPITDYSGPPRSARPRHDWPAARQPRPGLPVIPRTESCRPMIFGQAGHRLPCEEKRGADHRDYRRPGRPRRRRPARTALPSSAGREDRRGRASASRCPTARRSSTRPGSGCCRASSTRTRTSACRGGRGLGRERHQRDDRPGTAQVRAIDAINPADLGFRDAHQRRRLAVNVNPGSGNPIGGQTVAIKCWGRIVDEMVLRAPSG